jgi:hypothetical protein
MTISKKSSTVLWYECMGFASIIILLWLDEFVGAAQTLFGGEPHVRDWRDCAMTTLMVLYVWAIVFGFTKKMVDHLHYLEGLLRICAWCRKVGHAEKWMKVEDYFEKDFHIQTTHGMCPECLRKLKEDTAEFKRKEIEAEAQAAHGAAQGHCQAHC